MDHTIEEDTSVSSDVIRIFFGPVTAEELRYHWRLRRAEKLERERQLSEHNAAVPESEDKIQSFDNLDECLEDSCKENYDPQIQGKHPILDSIKCCENDESSLGLLDGDALKFIDDSFDSMEEKDIVESNNQVTVDNPACSNLLTNLKDLSLSRKPFDVVFSEDYSLISSDDESKVVKGDDPDEAVLDVSAAAKLYVNNQKPVTLHDDTLKILINEKLGECYGEVKEVITIDGKNSLVIQEEKSVLKIENDLAVHDFTISVDVGQPVEEDLDKEPLHVVHSSVVEGIDVELTEATIDSCGCQSESPVVSTFPGGNAHNEELSSSPVDPATLVQHELVDSSIASEEVSKSPNNEKNVSVSEDVDEQVEEDLDEEPLQIESSDMEGINVEHKGATSDVILEATAFEDKSTISTCPPEIQVVDIPSDGCQSEPPVVSSVPGEKAYNQELPSDPVDPAIPVQSEEVDSSIASEVPRSPNNVENVSPVVKLFLNGKPVILHDDTLEVLINENDKCSDEVKEVITVDDEKSLIQDERSILKSKNDSAVHDFTISMDVDEQVEDLNKEPPQRVVSSDVEGVTRDPETQVEDIWSYRCQSDSPVVSTFPKGKAHDEELSSSLVDPATPVRHKVVDSSVTIEEVSKSPKNEKNSKALSSSHRRGNFKLNSPHLKVERGFSPGAKNSELRNAALRNSSLRNNSFRGNNSPFRNDSFQMVSPYQNNLSLQIVSPYQNNSSFRTGNSYRNEPYSPSCSPLLSNRSPQMSVSSNRPGMNGYTPQMSVASGRPCMSGYSPQMSVASNRPCMSGYTRQMSVASNRPCMSSYSSANGTPQKEGLNKVGCSSLGRNRKLGDSVIPKPSGSNLFKTPNKLETPETKLKSMSSVSRNTTPVPNGRSKLVQPKMYSAQGQKTSRPSLTLKPNYGSSQASGDVRMPDRSFGAGHTPAKIGNNHFRPSDNRWGQQQTPLSGGFEGRPGYTGPNSNSISSKRMFSSLTPLKNNQETKKTKEERSVLSPANRQVSNLHRTGEQRSYTPKYTNRMATGLTQSAKENISTTTPRLKPFHYVGPKRTGPHYN